MAYRQFDFARNNHGAVALPHWQEDFNSPAISDSFIKARGGATANRQVPENFTYPHGKPHRAQVINVWGVRSLRKPLETDNSIYSDAPHWGGKKWTANQIKSSSLSNSTALAWQTGEQQTYKGYAML